MKNLLKLLLVFLPLFIADITLAQTNSSQTYTSGYYRSNGTYVQGYYKTAPNNTINDNFTTKPNVNPYTGQKGYIEPTYTTPSYNNSSYSTTPSYNNSTYSTPSYSAPVQTGPRGGSYYINGNGNKTYVKKSLY
jgi:hypothetical protein